jgi:hypothetical protein
LWEAPRPRDIGNGDDHINGMTGTSGDRIRPRYSPAKHERLARIKAECYPAGCSTSTPSIQLA